MTKVQLPDSYIQSVKDWLARNKINEYTHKEGNFELNYSNLNYSKEVNTSLMLIAGVIGMFIFLHKSMYPFFVNVTNPLIVFSWVGLISLMVMVEYLLKNGYLHSFAKDKEGNKNRCIYFEKIKEKDRYSDSAEARP